MEQEKNTLQPIQVGKNDYNNKRTYENWELAKKEVQEAVDSYNKLGYKSLTGDEFTLLFVHPAGLLYDKITGGKEIELGGLPVKKEKIFDIVNKPVGYDEMVKEVNDVTGRCYRGFSVNGEHETVAAFTARDIAKYFQLIDGKTVAYTDKHEAFLADVGNVYATYEQPQAVYKFLQAVVAAFYANGLDEHYKDKAQAPNGTTVYGKSIPKLCSLIDSIDHDTQTFKVKPKYFTGQFVAAPRKVEIE